MPIEISTGDTLLLRDGLQHWGKRNRSRLTLNQQTEVPEPDLIEGLSQRMTQVMNHYQREECHCFVCRATDHIALIERPSVLGTRSI